MKKNLIWFLAVGFITFSLGCSGGIESVDKSDGIDESEAILIAKHYQKTDEELTEMKVIKKHIERNGNIWQVPIGEEASKENKWIANIKGKVVYIDAQSGDVLQVLSTNN